MRDFITPHYSEPISAETDAAGRNFLATARSTMFRYLLQHGVPGLTWGDREFLPTAGRPGRTRQGGASPQLLNLNSI